MNAIIRSTYTPDGQRLEISEGESGFQIQTRWQRIGRPFDRITDAIAAFEVLEFCEGNLPKVYRRSVSVELRRTASWMVAGPAMARTWQVLGDTEKREAGLRPIACGSKSANVKWVHAS